MGHWYVIYCKQWLNNTKVTIFPGRRFFLPSFEELDHDITSRSTLAFLVAWAVHSY
jgi:hypothetical protein